LLEMIQTYQGVNARASATQRRHHKPRQNGNDRDDDQQFDQSESNPPLHIHTFGETTPWSENRTHTGIANRFFLPR
jgi:hypothetical protein